MDPIYRSTRTLGEDWADWPAPIEGERRERPMNSLWSAVFIAALGSSAWATGNGDDEKKSAPPTAADELRRIEELEKEIQKLKSDRVSRIAGLPERLELEDQEKKEAPKTEELEFKATFTDGFHIKTTDGNFDLHIGDRKSVV